MFSHMSFDFLFLVYCRGRLYESTIKSEEKNVVSSVNTIKSIDEKKTWHVTYPVLGVNRKVST